MIDSWDWLLIGRDLVRAAPQSLLHRLWIQDGRVTIWYILASFLEEVFIWWNRTQIYEMLCCCMSMSCCCCCWWMMMMMMMMKRLPSLSLSLSLSSSSSSSSDRFQPEFRNAFACFCISPGQERFFLPHNLFQSDSDDTPLAHHRNTCSSPPSDHEQPPSWDESEQQPTYFQAFWKQLDPVTMWHNMKSAAACSPRGLRSLRSVGRIPETETCVYSDSKYLNVCVIQAAHVFEAGTQMHWNREVRQRQWKSKIP